MKKRYEKRRIRSISREKYSKNISIKREFFFEKIVIQEEKLNF